jgi:excisionase family DNA binding protein
MLPLLSLREAARLLGVSFWSVRRLIQYGELPSVAVGRRVLIEPAAIEQFISTNRRSTRVY